MAAVGIDYGTSNSEVVYYDGTNHQFIELDPLAKSSNKIRSSIFFYYEDGLPLPQPEMVERKIEHIQRALKDQLDKAKQGYYEAKDPKEPKVSRLTLRKIAH